MSGGGNNNTGAKSAKYPFSSMSSGSNQTNNNNDTILAPPKLSKNRYSREELLVMFNLSAPAPSRLKDDFVDFYVDPAQNPVCMAPYTDIEQQLLVHGINSSKAMSKVDRYSGGPPHLPPNVAAGGGSPATTTNSRWSNLHSSAPNRGYGRGAGVDSFGGGNSAARQSRGFGTSALPTGIGRGRGVDTRLGPATQSTRPGENANIQLNPRAQGLYDPNNPKDRPRQRLKSKTDENDDVVHGGVAKQHHYVSGAGQHSQVQQSASTGSGLPEWVEEDDDYSTVGHDKKPNLIKTGSFDETGNFRRETTDQSVSGEKEQPATRRLPQTFSASAREKVADQPPPPAKVDLPAAPLLFVETNSSQKSVTADLPRFLQFLKTPSVGQQQETPVTSSNDIQRSAENMRLLKTPGSSTANSRTEDDVLSDLHSRAEGMIKSVFTDESVVASKFNRLLIGNSGQQVPIIPLEQVELPTIPLPQVELPTIPLPSLPLPVPAVALDPQRKLFLDSTWYYKDPSDTCQGPFSSEMMANWFAAGYFTMQLMIRPAFEPNFTSLGDIIKRIGGIPFQQSPATNSGAPTAPDAYANFTTAQKTSGFSSCNTGANNLDIFPKPSLNNLYKMYPIPGQQPSTIWDVYNNSGTNYGLNPVNKQNENIVTNVDNCVNNAVIPKESSLPTKETIERDLQKMLERLKAEDKKRQNEEAERQKALQAEMTRMLEEERKKMQELQLKLEREAQEKERLLKEAEAKLKAQLEMQQQAEESAWKKEPKVNQNQNPTPNVWAQKQMGGVQHPMVLGNLDAPVRSTDVEAWLQSAPQSTTASQNRVDKKAAKIRKEEERRQKLEEEQLRRENEEKAKEEQRLKIL
uniref:GYF domain-containing protein n=1 Tax=Romanomermis culicivorax TaxID=13658 RepID=A0A915KTZ3_ROMCU